MLPRLTVVILTLNEADNIGPCLQALAKQSNQEFEVLLIDADSTDGTTDAAVQVAEELGLRFRLHPCHFRMPIGESRNLGARLAMAPAVAYVSADVELAPDWIERALNGLATADMVFGHQVHAPHRRTIPAAVRGLRYRFPATDVQDGTRYASNVAGVYRTEILRRFPFDDEADAAEDLVLAKEATDAGYRIHYDPQMQAMHHDITRHAEEVNKNVREGRGWAAYRGPLGLHKEWLAWSALLAVGALASTTKRWRVPGIAGTIAILWGPSLRRAMRHSSPMAPLTTAKAAVIAPMYDLVFLANYLWGLAHPARRRRP